MTYWGNNSKAERELDLHHRPFRDGLQETLRRELEQLDDRTSDVS